MTIRKSRRPRVRYACRARPGPPQKATYATPMPSMRKAMTKAPAVMGRASYLSAVTLGLRRMRRFAARALPASERRKARCEARQVLVLRGALLVVDHQQPLRARAGLL